MTVKARAKQFAVNHNWWSDSGPVIDDLTAFAVSERELLLKEVITHERQRAVEICDLTLERMIDRDACARAIRNPESKYPSKNRQHGYGAQPNSISLLNLWHLLFPEGTHTEFEPQDAARWIDAYSEEVELHAKRLASKTDGAQGHGVGPRCPKCGTPVEVCRVAERTTKFSCQVACSKKPHPHLFLVNSVADFAQFFSPVPSPESATPLHGICPNCGADRSPSAEAHTENCPESATKRCEVCGATENLTVMGRNQYACPKHRATRESAEEKR